MAESYTPLEGQEQLEAFAHGQNVSDLPGLFSHDLSKRESMADVIKSKDKESIKEILSDPSFGQFAAEAYEADKGYSIRVNPMTGETEMFVAGTRDIGQWGLNLYDAAAQLVDSTFNKLADTTANRLFDNVPFHKYIAPHVDLPNQHTAEHADVWRKNKTAYYEQVARDNHVKVIYGHSRGAALVADMKLKGVTKIGLDGAMSITHNRDMVNYNEWGTGQVTGAFDGLIGFGGKKNIALDTDRKHFHSVYNKTGVKSINQPKVGYIGKGKKRLKNVNVGNVTPNNAYGPAFSNYGF